MFQEVSGKGSRHCPAAGGQVWESSRARLAELGKSIKRALGDPDVLEGFREALGQLWRDLGKFRANSRTLSGRALGRVWEALLRNGFERGSEDVWHKPKVAFNKNPG